MWLVNALAQLFLLNAFLGNDYYLFGFEVIEKLFKNERWTENRHFPKVTYWYVENNSSIDKREYILVILKSEKLESIISIQFNVY
jgi:hypothetical protein